MARIQLASSVAYLGELRETCGYGRLVDVDSFFFLFSFFCIQESVQQAICSDKVVCSDSHLASNFILLTLGNSGVTFLRIKGTI